MIFFSLYFNNLTCFSCDILQALLFAEADSIIDVLPDQN